MSKTKAERRAERRAKRQALVPYSPKPLAATSSSEHIGPAKEEAMLAFKAPIEYETPTIPFSGSADKLLRKALETNAVARREVVSTKTQVNWPVLAIVFGFYFVATWINITNAGGLANLSSPMVALGILAESGLFFLLPLCRRPLAAFVCVILFAFAVTNSLRMASITTADATQARAERTTAGTAQAKSDLDRALERQSRDCGPGLAKSKACALAQDGVKVSLLAAGKAAESVRSIARPESADFARLVEWASFGYVKVTESAYDMLWLLLRTLVPQLGGLVLLLARR